MRVFNKFGVCLLVAGLASAANADIIIDGQTLPIEDIDTYQVQVNAQGQYTIIIETTDGWTLEESNVVPDPDPITLSLSANPSSVNVGESVEFTWSSTNAETCTTSGGNAAWAALDAGLSGSANITMTLNPSSFQMTCSATGLNSVSRSRNITVIDPNGGGPTNCPSPEVNSGEVITWADFWGGQAFPDQDTIEKSQRIDRNDYVAIEFNTGNFNGIGRFKTIQVSSGVRNVALAACPGMFTEDVPAACFQEQSNGQGLLWSTDGTYECNLNPNQTYYLNMTYVDVEDVTSGGSLCSRTSCRFNLNSAVVPQ